MSFDDGLVTGLLLGRKLGGGSEGGDDWTFPEHWPDIPDPAPNQVIMYVEADAGDVAPIIGLYGTDSYEGGTINYGDDGYTYESPEGYAYDAYHVYQTAGQYIITVTSKSGGVDLNASYSNVAFMVGHIIENYQGKYNSSSGQCRCIRAIKAGSNVTLRDGYPTGSYYGKYLVYLGYIGGINGTDKPTFKNLYALKKIKIGSPPETFGYGAFDNCNSLEVIDGLQNCITISQYMFADCHALKGVEFPIAETASGQFTDVNYSLKRFYAPKLTAITANDFANCYSLQELTLADGCNLNGNTFENCPQLYPKPQ